MLSITLMHNHTVRSEPRHPTTNSGRIQDVVVKPDWLPCSFRNTAGKIQLECRDAKYYAKHTHVIRKNTGQQRADTRLVTKCIVSVSGTWMYTVGVRERGEARHCYRGPWTKRTLDQINVTSYI